MLVYVKNAIVILTALNVYLIIFFSTIFLILLDNVYYNVLLVTICQIIHAFYANPNAKLVLIIQLVPFAKIINFNIMVHAWIFVHPKNILLEESVKIANFHACNVLMHTHAHLAH